MIIRVGRKHAYSSIKQASLVGLLKLKQGERLMPQKEIKKPGELITPAEAAAITGTVSKKTITKWCRLGLVPAKQINHRWYINKEQFLRLAGLLTKP
jgi:hypothetical protein